MTKKDDNPGNLFFEQKTTQHNLEDIFKSCFISSNSELTNELVKRICDMHDYMKSIFCIGMAIEILKPNGLKIEFENELDNKFSYFIKSQNKIILNINTDTDRIYISLLDLFLYKWLELIYISEYEKRDLTDVLDQVFDNSSIFYEELTQKEIKMLEWLDKKLVYLVQSLGENQDIYKVNINSIDNNIANLISVYLMWGRNLERLEIVSQILNPLLDYINNIILTKFEKYVAKNYTNINNLPDYLKIKLYTIQLFHNENLSHKIIFKILKEIRILDMPRQTSKTFKTFKYSLANDVKLQKISDIYDKFKSEKKLYRYSILQRHDELSCIKEKKKKLIKDIKNNSEIIEQLKNLEDLISDEVRDLEDSLNIIDEKINLLKKAGV